MPTRAQVTPELAELRAELRRRGLGEVLDTSRLARALYSLRRVALPGSPQAVARPRTVDELGSVLDAARTAGLPVTTRGAGTSCAGNAVGPGLVVDVARHLKTILAIDPEARPARVQPGVVQAALQGQAAQYGLRFGPDPSTHNRCTIGGMIGNNACGPRALGYGKTADNVVALQVVTGAGDRVHFGPDGEGPARRSANGCTRWWPRTWARSGPSSALRSPGLRLQPAAPAAREPLRRRPVPGRYRGHPGRGDRGDRPAGGRRATQDHDRARLPDHGRCR